MEGTSHPAHRRRVASERQGKVSNMSERVKSRCTTLTEGVVKHLYIPICGENYVIDQVKLFSNNLVSNMHLKR